MMMNDIIIYQMNDILVWQEIMWCMIYYMEISQRKEEGGAFIQRDFIGESKKQLRAQNSEASNGQT